MHRASLLTVALLALLAAAPATGPVPAAPTGDAALPRDPANVYGQFANGLHYIVRHNTTPPGKVVLYLAVRTGSLNETAEQNGLAHFLEHMAFKGSTHFAPSKLIPLLTHLGMQFGADTNAHTNQYETVYKLTMPDAKPETVGTALTIFSDYASGLGLYPVQIDSERRVILEEVRMRRGPALRMQKKLDAALFPNTQMAVHDVLGDPEIIKSAQQPLYQDYWNTWYRPEKMTLIVVGDVDPQSVIAQAEPLLGRFTARAPERKTQSAGLHPFTAPQAVVLSDPEQADAGVELMWLRPPRPAITTMAEYRQAMVESLAAFIVNRRCSNWVSRGDAPFQSAGFSSGDMLRDGFASHAGAEGEVKKWPAVLDGLIAELRDGLDHPFTPRECDLACAAVRAGAERAAQTESTTDSSAFVKALTTAVDTDQPLLSATQDLELVREVLKTVTPAEIHAAFVADYASPNFACVLQLPSAPALPDRQQLLDAVQNAWQHAPTTLPSDAGPTVAGLPRQFPPAKVADTSVDAALGVTTTVFDNGVVMHHRFSDHKKDQVLVHLTLPGGALQETAANHGISNVATLLFARPATSSLGSTQLRDMFNGKSVAVHGGIGVDAMSVDIGGSRHDLPDGLAMARAILTDGRLEAPTLAEWKRSTQQALLRRALKAETHLGDAVWATLDGSDPRLAPLTAEQVEQLQLQPAEAWFHGIADHAAIEVGVVGDISASDAVDLIGKYFGSLPHRTGSFSDLDALRTVKHAPGPFTSNVDYPSVEPKALVLAGFLGCDEQDPQRRPLSLASMILTERMIKQMRFDQQLVYSIRCQSAPATALPGLGMLSASTTTDPRNADKLAHEILDQLKTFAADGPTDDELATAKKQMQNKMAVQLNDPVFWLSEIAELDYRHRPLKQIEELPAVYDTFSAEQVRAAVRQCVSESRMLCYEVLPKPMNSSSTTQDSAAALIDRPELPKP